MTDSRYDDVTSSLRSIYDTDADRRDRTDKTPWKVEERTAFLERLREQDCRHLLEIGAGTGQDSEFFAGQGLEVVATDLSPAMVERCRAKGIDARVMDTLHLDFPDGRFDAAYTMNCLLHVPNTDLPASLAEIARVLRPGGLFFLGVYGGDGSEGLPDWDQQDKRFFSFRTDEQIQEFARGSFQIVDFHVRDLGAYTFQSLTLRTSTAV